MRQQASQPQKLTQAQQNQQISELKKIANISDKQAQEILEICKGNLQQACNYYGDIQSKSQKLETHFYRYQDPKQPDFISDTGIQKLCDDLGIDLMDPIILYISWKFSAEKMGIYTKSEFTIGLFNLKCQSIEELKQKIPRLREDYKRLEVMKSVYRFCFDFAKTKKELDFLVAQGLWQAMISDTFPLMPKMIQYLEQIPEDKRKSVTKDTWFMVWEFNMNIGDDLSKYDYVNGAWPTFLDEFYFYLCPHHKR